MNVARLTDSLSRLFVEERHRIVFWDDVGGEFNDVLPQINLDGVTLLRRDELTSLEIKIRLELEDREGRYLVYAPATAPAPEDDWLLDIRLYSRTFEADTASMLLDELGLERRAMRDHLAARRMFLRSTDRLARLKRFVTPHDSERDLDRKMIAVILRADGSEPFDLLTRLFGELCRNEGCDLHSAPRALAEIERFDLAPALWELVSVTYGYASAEPTVADLLIRLFVTDFVLNLAAEVPIPLRHFVLPNRRLTGNVGFLLGNWRKNISTAPDYNTLANQIERDLRLDSHLVALDEKVLGDTETFEAVERRIASCLRDRVIESANPNTAPLDMETFRVLVRSRLDKHWAHPTVGVNRQNNDRINPYQAIYAALDAAAELFRLRRAHADGFTRSSPAASFYFYTDELYRFDQFYRLCLEAADRLEPYGWDILRELRSMIETLYSEWFIDRLAAAWSASLDPTEEAGLLRTWQLEGTSNQQDFYRTHVRPLLEATPNAKVYVVISDAFRFEAAEELTRALNATNRLNAVLSPQLGVLPSYTALGMAALLPHEHLRFRTGASLDVLADGTSTAGLQARSAVLARFGGIAIKAGDLLAMSKEQGREFVREQRVVYIYHDQIDAAGDKPATEGGTFVAVRTTINELADLTRYIVNNLNGSNVLVTADHGFLFQETSPTAPDRSNLDDKPMGTLRAKKRYLLGTNLKPNPGDAGAVWHGHTDTTAGTIEGLEFWIPKGANRFHFIGGARFVHGGAMPQEIVVPVITVKLLRGQAAERSTVRQVGVSLLGSVRRIVNNVQRFEFIQTDAASDRVQSRTLFISLRDPANGDALISNEVTLTFDGTSPAMDERRMTAQLVIKTGSYERRDYALVLRDANTQIEYDRYPVTIDIAFGNDF